MARNRIYEQVEASADYYDPGIYAARLTQHSSLELVPDVLASDFIPVTSVSKNSKLFAVGLIPPAANVTGRLLDRSRSVAALAGGVVGTLDVPDGSKGKGANPVTGDGKGGIPGPSIYKLTYKQAAVAMREAIKKQTGSYPSDVELAMYVTHSNRETSDAGRGVIWPDFNPGYVGNATVNSPRPGGHSRFYWASTKTTFYSYPTAVDGAVGYMQFIPGPARKAAKDGDIDAYVKALADVRYFGNDDPEKYRVGFVNAYRFIRGQIGPQSGLNGVTLPEPARSISGDSGAPAFQSTGSQAANNAQRQISKGGLIDLNTTDLGKKFAQAQSALAKAVQAELDAMANTPPLRLLVNPQSFKVSHEQVVTEGSWTRHGAVIEHWGGNQDKIEGSGKVAAFQVADLSDGKANGPGMTRMARAYSAAYQNLLSLYQIYRNNAGLYVAEDVTTGSRKTNLVMTGSVYIYYDHTLYVGSFDSFTLTEADGSPYSIEYSFSFTVRAMFLLDEISDPKYTYGITSLDVNRVNDKAAVIPTNSTGDAPASRSIAELAQDPNDPVNQNIAKLLQEQQGKSVVLSEAQGGERQPGSLGVPVFDSEGRLMGVT